MAVVRGSPVLLPCEARGNPLPLVSWMKDGEPLLSQSLEQGPGLLLESAEAGDSGSYSCVAVSEAGEARRHFQLTVMGGSPAPTSASLGLGGEGGALGAMQKAVREGSPSWGSRLGGGLGEQPVHGGHLADLAAGAGRPGCFVPGAVLLGLYPKPRKAGTRGTESWGQSPRSQAQDFASFVRYWKDWCQLCVPLHTKSLLVLKHK